MRVSLANVELLTIRIRLLVCSIDKAEQIGLNWWRYDRISGRPGGSRQRPLRDSKIASRNSSDSWRRRTAIPNPPHLRQLDHPAPRKR